MENKDFTIIIPEHNRPNHLIRLLEYYLDQNVNVIVADSSKNIFYKKNEYEDKIIYRYFPGRSLAEKLCEVQNYIKTPYVVMCANDDFVIPSAIRRIIEYLDDNREYNSGQGIYAGFNPDDNNINLDLRYKHMIDFKINEITGAKRVLQLMSRYFQYYYAVYRTEVFIETYSSVIKNNKTRINNLCLLESYVSSYPAIKGKHIILPILYAVRENNKISAGSTTDNLSIIKKNPKYTNEYESYINLLSLKLSKQDNISYSLAEDYIRKSVEVYLSVFFPTNYLKSSIKYLLLKTNMLSFVKVLMLDLSDLKTKLKSKKSSFEIIENMHEWLNIKKYILKYYKQCYRQT